MRQFQFSVVAAIAISIVAIVAMNDFLQREPEQVDTTVEEALESESIDHQLVGAAP